MEWLCWSQRAPIYITLTGNGLVVGEMETMEEKERKKDTFIFIYEIEDLTISKYKNLL